jgi:hypothetical protein
VSYTCAIFFRFLLTISTEGFPVTTKLIQFTLVAFVIFVGAHGVTAQNCIRHVEMQGGFSVCIPDSWTVREEQNEKYKQIVGQPSDGFTPNINFREETTTMSLSSYVAAGVKNILASTEKLGATSIEPLGQSDFTTEAGLRGIRAVFQTMFKGFLVRTIQYYFDAGDGRKFIITSTSLDKNKEVFDRVFDRNAKSFRLN